MKELIEQLRAIARSGIADYFNEKNTTGMALHNAADAIECLENELTSAEIANWFAYERVCLKGRWNMFASQARQATGLSSDEYTFVMENYSALSKAAKEEIA